MFDSDYLEERIASIKANIEAYEAASLALATGVESYTLDTTQGKQTVTRASAASINRLIQALYNQLATLEARCYGYGTKTGKPSW